MSERHFVVSHPEFDIPTPIMVTIAGQESNFMTWFTVSEALELAAKLEAVAQDLKEAERKVSNVAGA